MMAHRDGRIRSRTLGRCTFNYAQNLLKSSRKALAIAVKNVDMKTRQTTLKKLLSDEL